MYLTFDNPIYLWLLFSIPLFIISHFYFLRRSKSKAISFANFDTLRRIGQEKIPTKNLTHLTLRLLILTSLIFSASGTSYWYKGQSSNMDFVVALDTSASMTAEDVRPDRFTAAKQYTSAFLDSIDADSNVGLITFGGSTLIEQTPTDDRLKFRLALERVEISDTGGTDIAGALIIGTNLLENSENRGKSLILISDGINTVKTNIQDPVMVGTKYAKDHQVIVHTIGVGTNAGPIGYLPEYYNISASFDERDMKYIANETEGVYVHATTTDELVQAFGLISSKKSERYLKINVSFGAMLLSLALLFIEWGLTNTVYRRIM